MIVSACSPAPVELAEAEVAVGGERAHAELVGERQRLAVVGRGRCAYRLTSEGAAARVAELLPRAHRHAAARAAQLERDAALLAEARARGGRRLAARTRHARSLRDPVGWTPAVTAASLSARAGTVNDGGGCVAAHRGLTGRGTPR
jgi:hypothetical protein